MALKLGVREIPWFTLTLWLTGIYSAILILSMFFKADFLNVSTIKIKPYL